MQEVNESYASKGVAVLGIIPDWYLEESIEAMNERNADYTNILEDYDAMYDVASKIQGYPTTLFVNSKGELVGEELLGVYTDSSMKKKIDSLLKAQ